MSSLRVRLRNLRPCDRLLLAVVCLNLVYLVYHFNTPGDELYEVVPDTQEVAVDTQDVTAGQGIVKREIAIGQDSVQTETPPMSAPETSWPVLPPCPDQPPSLLGPLACDCEPAQPEFLISVFQNLELGGRLRPRDCRPRERTAIIIPYRNRHEHLHALLRMLIPILIRQQLDATLFVIDQVEPDLFNRGALTNVGFLEALKLASFDCFIFQDVDLVPLDDRLLYRCSSSPVLLASSIKFGKWLSMSTMPKNYMGGVVAFSRQQYQLVNGHSNLYFDTGGEDEDLNRRITNKNMARTRASQGVAIYNMLAHDTTNLDEGSSPLRSEILKSAKERQDVEGLSSSTYTVVGVRYHQLYTWIKVSLNMTEIFKTAPDYTLRDMEKVILADSKS